ncbi:unnamed protein product [Allacma fusca]|uniref:Uncharacterized protein n=1 Tax=Allacma fusca TaxID=39272 RepID=A0A8J2K657_9HEXA|nr:unnamed protein product [Allacma fusca]
MSEISSAYDESSSHDYYNTSQSAKNGSYASSSSGYYLTSSNYSASPATNTTSQTKQQEDRAVGPPDKNEKPENECFKVVQMVSDPACPPPSGIIGYVYTYTIRKRRRIVKKAVSAKQPYQVVIVKESAAQEMKRTGGPEQKIQQADDEIAYANRQIARYYLDKKRAKQRRKDAEEMRFNEEERVKEREVRGSRPRKGDEPKSQRDSCKQHPNAIGCKNFQLPNVTVKYVPRSNKHGNQKLNPHEEDTDCSDDEDESA